MGRKIIASVMLAMFVSGILGALDQPTSSSAAQDAATPAPPGAVREVIGAGTPDAEDVTNDVLELVRYVIDPGAKLAPHTHPGMQVNVIESGTLHYVVVEGTLYYTRAADAGTPGAVQQLSGGEEIDFQPGDSFVEPQGMVHFGENRTTEPIVVLTASLFEAGEPPSTSFEATPAS